MTLPQTREGWTAYFADTLPSERVSRAIDLLMERQAPEVAPVARAPEQQAPIGEYMRGFVAGAARMRERSLGEAASACSAEQTDKAGDEWNNACSACRDHILSLYGAPVAPEQQQQTVFDTGSASSTGQPETQRTYKCGCDVLPASARGSASSVAMQARRADDICVCETPNR